MMPARTHLHSLDEIGDALRARSLDLCHALKLQGRYEPATREFVALNPLRNDRSLGSFRIVCEGAKQGLIKDFAGSGQSWSWLGFIAELWFGNDKARAVEWAKRFLGLDGGDADALRKTARAVQERQEIAALPNDADKRMRGAAHFIYTKATQELYGRLKGAPADAPEVLLDTPVYRYLKGRGIDLARFPFKSRGIHWHPDLHHKPSCEACKAGLAYEGDLCKQHQHYPAMVLAIVPAEGRPLLGIHRTFLKTYPDGTVTKAPVGKDAKLCLGRYAGGMIRVWKGINVNPETGVITKRATLAELAKRVAAGRAEKIDLHIAEGFENALSVAWRFPEFTVAAGVSVSNMGGIHYPPAVGRVVFWRDNDLPGSQADRDFAKVIANAQRQGLDVREVKPPEGFKDVNDVLVRAQPAATPTLPARAQDEEGAA